MRSLFLKIFLWFWLAMALVVIVFVVLVANTQEEPSEPQRPPEMRRRPRIANDALTIYLETAAHILEHDGPGALSGYLDRMEKTGRIHTFVFDEHGTPVRRHAPPPDALPSQTGQQPPRIDLQQLQQLVQRAKSNEQPQFIPAGFVLLAAQRAQMPQTQVPQKGRALHRHYVIVGAMRADPFRPPPRDRNRPDGVVAGATGPDRDGPPRGRRRDGRFPFWLGWLFAGLSTQALRLIAVLLTTGVVCYGLVRHLTTPIIQLRAATQRLAAGDLTTRVGATLGKRRDELGVLGRDFDLMAERIESLMNAQKRLIVDISHELRSPLARVTVALGLVRQDTGPEAAEDLDRIELETERLNTMIGQLLTLSRLESGEKMAENAPVDVARLVQEIAADADFEACSRGCSVRVQSTVECKTSGTESLLRSAIENVARNAVRYTEEGTTVEISLNRERDTLEGTQQGKQNHHECAVIRVRDHGMGVPEESLEHIFRPFYRIADARDRQTGGTGLGLAIAERAVRLHGGTVRAANAPGGGLLVEMRLPLRGPHQLHEPAADGVKPDAAIRTPL